MSYKVTILGCGNSEGVPAIGNFWGACDPSEPKNRRTRPSIAVQNADTALIIDTGPDFKQQIDAHNIQTIDAVLYTHAHADHVTGIDDLRAWVKRTHVPMNVYGNKETIEELEQKYDYQFKQKSATYPAVLNAHIIDSTALNKPMRLGDIEFIPFEQDHGACKSLGFRFGNLAYSTDLIDLPEISLKTLKGIQTWVVDAAGYKSATNPVHLSLARIYELYELIGAQNIYLTHLSHCMDYKTLIEELPDGYRPAYDGLIVQS